MDLAMGLNTLIDEKGPFGRILSLCREGLIMLTFNVCVTVFWLEAALLDHGYT